jgi:hypothetical protein
MAALFDINTAHCALVHIPAATFSGQWLRNNSSASVPAVQPHVEPLAAAPGRCICMCINAQTVGVMLPIQPIPTKAHFNHAKRT